MAAVARVNLGNKKICWFVRNIYRAWVIGNGKTTLLRLVAGELAKTTGTVSYFEQAGLEWYDIKGKIAFISQRPNRWYGTLIDNLNFFCSINGIGFHFSNSCICRIGVLLLVFFAGSQTEDKQNTEPTHFKKIMHSNQLLEKNQAL